MADHEMIMVTRLRKSCHMSLPTLYMLTKASLGGVGRDFPQEASAVDPGVMLPS